MVAGALNAVAGGGSFITLPVLLYAGVPPVSANATGTFARVARIGGERAWRIAATSAERASGSCSSAPSSLAGGLIGGLLLVKTSDSPSSGCCRG